MQCPECKSEIGAKATYCGCGWRKMRVVHGSGRHEPSRCAHDDCGIDALYKVQTKTGLSNFCWQHYDEHYERQAIANLPKWGMQRTAGESQADNVARMREFVKGGFKRFAAAAGKR